MLGLIQENGQGVKRPVCLIVIGTGKHDKP